MNTTDTSSQPTAAEPPSQPLGSLAEGAQATLNEAKEQGNEQFEQVRDLATGQLDALAEGAQSVASALQDQDSLGLSNYLGQLATGLSGFADQVREQSAGALLHKGAQVARENPGLFLAGSVAVGFALSRFLRAGGSPQADAPVPDDSIAYTNAPSVEPAPGIGQSNYPGSERP